MSGRTIQHKFDQSLSAILEQSDNSIIRKIHPLVHPRATDVQARQALERVQETKGQICQFANLRELKVVEVRVARDEEADAVVVESCRLSASMEREGARTRRLHDPKPLELVVLAKGAQIQEPLLERHEVRCCTRRQPGARSSSHVP